MCAWILRAARSGMLTLLCCLQNAGSPHTHIVLVPRLPSVVRAMALYLQVAAELCRRLGYDSPTLLFLMQCHFELNGDVEDPALLKLLQACGPIPFDIMILWSVVDL